MFSKTVFMPEVWQQYSYSKTNFIRVYGLLKGPNELALFLMIAFICSLYLLTKVEGRKKVWVYIGLTIIGSTFLLTYSRGAFLALLVFIALYLLLFRNFKRIIPIVIVALCSGLIFLSVVSFAESYQANVLDQQTEEGKTEKKIVKKPKNTTKQPTGEGLKRYKETFSEDTLEMSASDGRLYYVTKAVEVFKDHPIIGTGFATFGGAATLAYSSPIYEEYEIGFNFYSDNQYILTLAETGIVGVLLLTLLLYNFLKITYRTYKETDKNLAIILVFFFSTMMVGGMVYNILENDTFTLYYFLALGFAHQLLSKEKLIKK